MPLSAKSPERLRIVASRLLAPERSTLAKSSSYECGIVDQAEIPERYRRWLSRADANGDGEIDQEEMDAAARRLGRR